MNKRLLALGLAAFMLTTGASGLDLPFDIGFQIGFRVQVIPAPNDISRELGLVVAVHEVVNDTKTHLAVKGSVTNFSDVTYDDIDMHFNVTSYIETSTMKKRAVVQPNRLPPGSTATFNMTMFLDYELPRFAMYTITAARR